MIESINNEKIKQYSKLKDKKYRTEMSLFLVEGEHLVAEGVKQGVIKEIMLLTGENSPYPSVTYVTKEVMKKLSNLTTPPKIIAVCHLLKPKPIIGNVLMLDDISDPGNLGTIIRSAVAFNYETLIISPQTVDLYNSKVIRASEGMLFNINIIVSPLADIISVLKKDGYFILGTDVKKGNLPSKLKQKHVLIIGSEARGINHNLLSLCDEKLSLKMNQQCESLNAAVAASILMYELS